MNLLSNLDFICLYLHIQLLYFKLVSALALVNDIVFVVVVVVVVVVFFLKKQQQQGDQQANNPSRKVLRLK